MVGKSVKSLFIVLLACGFSILYSAVVANNGKTAKKIQKGTMPANAAKAVKDVQKKIKKAEAVKDDKAKAAAARVKQEARKLQEEAKAAKQKAKQKAEQEKKKITQALDQLEKELEAVKKIKDIKQAQKALDSLDKAIKKFKKRKIKDKSLSKRFVNLEKDFAAFKKQHEVEVAKEKPKDKVEPKIEVKIPSVTGCTGCSVRQSQEGIDDYDGNYLTCTCNGKKVELPLYDKCPTSIEYDSKSGRLICKIPDGPYQDQCKSCGLTARDEYMTLACLDCGGALAELEKAVGCSDCCVDKGKKILACGQQLACGTCKPLPTGSYQNVCVNCGVSMDGTLSCSCNDNSTKLLNAANCSTDITVDDKNSLICKELSGSYSNSCSGCQLTGDNFDQLECDKCSKRSNVSLTNATKCKDDIKDCGDCGLVCGSCTNCECQDNWPIGDQECQCSIDSYCDGKCAGKTLPGNVTVGETATGICKCYETGSGVSADGKQISSKHCVYGNASERQFCPKPPKEDKQNQDWANEFCASGLVCSEASTASGGYFEHKCMRKCTKNEDCSGEKVCRYYNRLSGVRDYGVCGDKVPEGETCYHHDECVDNLGCRDDAGNMCESRDPSKCSGTCTKLKEWGEKCAKDADCLQGINLRCIELKCRYGCKKKSDCNYLSDKGMTACHWDKSYEWPTLHEYGYCDVPSVSAPTDCIIYGAPGLVVTKKQCDDQVDKGECSDSSGCGDGIVCAKIASVAGIGFSLEKCEKDKKNCFPGSGEANGYCWEKGDPGDNCHSTDGLDCKSGKCIVYKIEDFAEIDSVPYGVCQGDVSCNSADDCKNQGENSRCWQAKIHGKWVSSCISPRKEGLTCSPDTCADGNECYYWNKDKSLIEQCTKKGCLGVCIPISDIGNACLT